MTFTVRSNTPCKTGGGGSDIDVHAVVAVLQHEHDSRRTILRCGDNRMKSKRNFIHVSVVFNIFKQIKPELVQPKSILEMPDCISSISTTSLGVV
jgi:hypothetical protein